ncbi:MAG: DUF1194 domain-containing protein [Pseudomonadota bacterium]
MPGGDNAEWFAMPIVRRSIMISAAMAFLNSTPFAADQSVAPETDLALVLAADISYSVDPDELDLQRKGYISAFRSPEIVKAIKSGFTGRVAVTYLEWAGPDSQAQIVPWTVIDGAETAFRFADRLAAETLHRSGETSISAALEQAALLFETAPPAPRRVIDLSADGYNNAGGSVLAAREWVLWRGITINGLPILTDDATNLEAYFRDCVVGGPGAMLFPVQRPEDFAQTLLRKLVTEIAWQGPAGLVQVAAHPSADCAAGEKQARDDYLRQLHDLTNGRSERWLPREEDWPTPK